MLGKLPCWLGLHRWWFTDRWEPSFDAPIVTLWEHTSLCTRCGRRIVHQERFDPETGAPAG